MGASPSSSLRKTELQSDRQATDVLDGTMQNTKQQASVKKHYEMNLQPDQEKMSEKNATATGTDCQPKLLLLLSSAEICGNRPHFGRPARSSLPGSNAQVRAQ